MTTNLLERASIGRGWDPRVAATLALALVFLCGVAAGAVAMELGFHSRLHRAAFDTPAGQALNFEKVQRELDLTPAQAEQVQLVLQDMWQYYRTVLSDSKARVEQVLTQAQRQKFEHLLQQQR